MKTPRSAFALVSLVPWLRGVRHRPRPVATSGQAATAGAQTASLLKTKPSRQSCSASREAAGDLRSSSRGVGRRPEGQGGLTALTAALLAQGALGAQLCRPARALYPMAAELSTTRPPSSPPSTAASTATTAAISIFTDVVVAPRLDRRSGPAAPGRDQRGGDGAARMNDEALGKAALRSCYYGHPYRHSEIGTVRGCARSPSRREGASEERLHPGPGGIGLAGGRRGAGGEDAGAALRPHATGAAPIELRRPRPPGQARGAEERTLSTGSVRHAYDLRREIGLLPGGVRALVPRRAPAAERRALPGAARAARAQLRQLRLREYFEQTHGSTYPKPNMARGTQEFRSGSAPSSRSRGSREGRALLPRPPHPRPHSHRGVQPRARASSRLHAPLEQRTRGAWGTRSTRCTTASPISSNGTAPRSPISPPRGCSRPCSGTSSPASSPSRS